MEKEKKKTKFIKCKKCGRNSVLFICVCGNNLTKNKDDKNKNQATISQSGVARQKI